MGPAVEVDGNDLARPQDPGGLGGLGAVEDDGRTVEQKREAGSAG